MARQVVTLMLVSLYGGCGHQPSPTPETPARMASKKAPAKTHGGAGKELTPQVCISLRCEPLNEKTILRLRSSNQGAAFLRLGVKESGLRPAIRARCAHALAMVGLARILAADLLSVDETTRHKISPVLVDKLLDAMKGDQPGKTMTTRITAKDALFELRAVLQPALRGRVDRELIRWIMAKFPTRDAGDNSTEKIIKTIGIKAGPVLVEALGDATSHPLAISLLLRSVATQEDRDAAAKRLVALAKARPKIDAKIFEALGRVGSVHALDYLAPLARRGDLYQRVYALRAMQLFPHVRSLPTAQAVAADESLKKKFLLVRQEGFNLLAKIPDAKALDALAGFMEHKNEAVRYTAMDGMINGFKVKGLPRLLERISLRYAYKEADLEDLVVSYIVDLGPRGLPAVRKGLASRRWPSRLVAVRVLARIGKKQDISALSRHFADRTRIKGWGGKTIGSQARVAAGRIQGRK